MKKVLSKYEQFVKERDERIISMFKELTEGGTAKMVAYRTIGESLTPPMHETAILRILRKHGLNNEPSDKGRPRKDSA